MRPINRFPFMILVLLYIFGSANGICAAAAASPEIRVGSELDFPPYALMDKKGQPDGFSIDLIKAVAAAMGVSVKISTGTWDTVWNSLVSGQLDVLPIVAKTSERQNLVNFGIPHTETFDAFFVRQGEPFLPDIASARGKEIVVMRSDAAHHQILERNFQGKLTLVDTIPEGLKILSSGKHHAVLCSKLIGTLSIKKDRITGITAGPPIPDYKRVFSFAVKKGEGDLLEKLNQGLLIVKINGEYDQIYEKWLTFDDPWRKVRKYLLPAVISIIALSLIVGVWIRMLQRLVRKRSLELVEKNEMLLKAYDKLEVRIQERTVELTQTNQSLQSEIAKRKQSEEKLMKSEKHFRSLFENMLEGFTYCRMLFDEHNHPVDFVYLDVNSAFEKLTGLKNVTGKPVTEVIPGITELNPELFDITGRVALTGQTEVFEIDFKPLAKWLFVSVYSMDRGTFVAVFDDITLRKQAEKEIKSSLHEKETMLKEIHHRVKNNLAVISSLLGLQARYLKDKKSREIFQESQDRLKVMANIHTLLYQSEDLARVDFGGFIKNLISSLQKSYRTVTPSVEIYVDIADVSLNIEISLPCGLILNELVSNALKHAYPEGRGGEIHVKLTTDGDRYVLQVLDKGIGFPKSVDFQNTQTLGLTLVNTLVEQIKGTIDLTVDNGTKFTITFPMANRKG